MRVDFPVIDRRLENGLRIVISPERRVPLVGVALYYDVGARDEVPGRSGYAHLFEHLMFEGSANAPRGQHFQLISRFGGQLNGSTSADRTCYYQSLPSSQLALGLWLEADRMRALSLTAEVFEGQRQTVMEERRQRVDDAPYGAAMVRIGELSYDAWAYAHPVIGYWADLEAAELEWARDFHARWYRPDNAVLGVSGDVDPDEVFALAQDWFGDIAPGGPQARPPIVEPRRAAPIRETLYAPAARLPLAVVNHQAPGFADPRAADPSAAADFYAFEVLETALFRGRAARLHRRLVIDQPLAVQISGGYDARRGPSLFSFSAAAPAGAGPEALDQIVEIYQGELDRVAAEGLPAAEHARAMNQLRAARIYALEGILRRARAVAQGALYADDPGWENRYLDGVSAVTPEDIRRVAATWLTADTRLQVRVLPGPEPSQADPEESGS